MTEYTAAVRVQVDERDGGACRRCGRPLHGNRFSRHHRKPRGMGGANRRDAGRLSNIVLLCGSATSAGGCHEWVERNRAEATQAGWIVPSWADPEQVPIRTQHGEDLWLRDNGSIVYTREED